MNVIRTRRGEVRLPAYMPVTTWGGEYPTDELTRPFMGRFADMLMVSLQFARSIDREPDLPLFIDSGGFAALFRDSILTERPDGTASITAVTPNGHEVITPEDVLGVQNKWADFASTLDIPVPPRIEDEAERERRMRLTLANARWAAAAPRREDLVLFGSVQGWDVDSYVHCAQQLQSLGFHHFAIGGMVPRSTDLQLLVQIVSAVRTAVGPRPMVHIFGIGEPQSVKALFAAGATSTDSSSYVKAAASGRRWDGVVPPGKPSRLERAHMALANLAYAARTCGAGTGSIPVLD